MLVFATNNKYKLTEVNKMLSSEIEIVSLAEIGCTADIPETADTLQGNALLKAEFVWINFQKDCFADDTGLEVKALNGAPGVYTARFAGKTQNIEANVDKLLKVMEGVEDRSARFRTVIALIQNGEIHYFEGIVNGSITTERRGNKGFGYDPVFIPEGYTQSFAELGEDLKNKISHRAKAINLLTDYLMK